jgi:hypothetical protein
MPLEVAVEARPLNQVVKRLVTPPSIERQPRCQTSNQIVMPRKFEVDVQSYVVKAKTEIPG